MRVTTRGLDWRGLAVVAAGVLATGSALAACGGGGSAGATATTRAPAATSTTGSTAAEAPTTTGAGDAALARSELLPTTAYPSGWTDQGSGSEDTQASFFGGNSAADIATMAACLGISTTGIDATPVEAAGQEYDDPNSNLTVTDSVEVFPTVAAATTDVEAAASAKAPGCITRLAASRLSKAVPQGMTVGHLIASASPVPAHGAHDGALTMTFPITNQGVSETMHIEMVVVQQGRSETVLQFMDSVTPPTAVVDPLVAAAAARLRTS